MSIVSGPNQITVIFHTPFVACQPDLLQASLDIEVVLVENGAVTTCAAQVPGLPPGMAAPPLKTGKGKGKGKGKKIGNTKGKKPHSKKPKKTTKPKTKKRK